MKYLVYGYYGYNNLGDELLLNTIVNNISNKDKNAKFKILNKSSDTLMKYANVEYTDIRDILHDSNNKILKFINFFKAFKKYIDECDTFIIGGGTLFMDSGKYSILMMYLSVFIKYAKIKNKKVVLLGVGIDILANPFSNIWMNKILKNSDKVNLRDKLSYQIANKINNNQNLFLTQDLVFSNNNYFNIKNTTKEKVIGISLINYSDKVKNINFIKEINKIIKYYLDNNFKIKLLSFQTNIDKSDNLFYQSIENVNRCEIAILNIDNIYEIYQNLHYVLSMRFHGILLGLMFNKKVLGIVHEIKNYQLCFDSKIDYLMLEDLKIENILKKDYKTIDDELLFDLKKQSNINFDNLGI
jgi:polysaccharide pyruvyl transferase WcaK-like protein